MNTKTGTLDAVIKAAKNSGEFEAILSMPTLDRDNEIIDTLAFAPLPEKITIDIDHGMSVATTVGSGVPFYDADGTLKFRGTFASTPLAQDVRTLVVEGHIDRMSVAYRNAKYEIGDDGVDHLRSAELLNAAIVPIPANREAAILVAKAHQAGVSTKDAVQSIYDQAIALGAVCPVCEKSAPVTEQKSTNDPEAPAPAGKSPAIATVEAKALAALAEAAALLL
jgi:HK97 family phage prohead protease